MAKKTSSPTPIPVCGLEAVQKLALAQADAICATKDERNTVATGEYPVDFSVHIKGTVKVGKDSETTQVNKLHPLLLFLIAMRKLNGVSRKAIIAEAVAYTKSEGWEEAFEAEQELLKPELEELLGTCKQPRKGSVKFDGLVVALNAEIQQSVQIQGK